MKKANSSFRAINFKANSRNKGSATSAKALQFCTPNYTPMTSFKNLHTQNYTCTCSPIYDLTLFTAALCLQQLTINPLPPSKNWLDVNLNQIFKTLMQDNFGAFNSNFYKIGKNNISERLCILNGKIPLNWLKQDKTSYKLQCKSKCLPSPLNPPS